MSFRKKVKSSFVCSKLTKKAIAEVFQKAQVFEKAMQEKVKSLLPLPQRKSLSK